MLCLYTLSGVQAEPLEICFWPGEPEIVIPFDEAKPFLTKEALEVCCP